MDILQVRELKQSLERRDARILELEAQLEAARQPQERGEAVALNRQALFDLIANTDTAASDYSGDNVAVALCSYFEDHGARPDDDEPVSDEHCWGAWVEEQYAATVYAIADRILEAHPPAADARADDFMQENAARMTDTYLRAQDRIAALEAQLAESRLQTERWRESFMHMRDKSDRMQGERDTAVEQLVESREREGRMRDMLKMLAIGFGLAPDTPHENLCRWAKECIRDIEALAADKGEK